MSDEKKSGISVSVGIVGADPKELTNVEKASGIISMLATLFDNPDDALVAITMVSKFMLEHASPTLQAKMLVEGVASTLEEAANRMIEDDRKKTAERETETPSEPKSADTSEDGLTAEQKLMLRMLKHHKVGEA